MNIRKRYLPAGWYPSDQKSTLNKIETMVKGLCISTANAVAGVVPHAGWEFSGRVALEVFASIKTKADTIVVVGGHLSQASGIYAAFEQGYETPLGIIDADLELLAEIKKGIPVKEDITADNTVEIQLPFLKYYFPESKALWMRAAPSSQALQLSRVLFEAEKALKRKIIVIGSTDLTHYGLNYGFMPKGTGKQAVVWVKEENDKRIIQALVEQRLEQALEYALSDHSACSAGGAVTAAGFACEKGLKQGKLLSYLTSWDIYPSESFVGYAGIIYSKE